VYQVKLDKEQMETVIRALDLYMRLGIHQIDEVKALALEGKLLEKAPLPNNWHNEVDYLLAALKSYLWGEALHAGPGICNPQVPKTFKLACEICHVLRRFLAFEREPQGGMGVAFSEVLPISGHPSLAQVEKI